MCVSPIVAERAAEPDVNIRCESSRLELLSLMNNKLDRKQEVVFTKTNQRFTLFIKWIK